MTYSLEDFICVFSVQMGGVKPFISKRKQKNLRIPSSYRKKVLASTILWGKSAIKKFDKLCKYCVYLFIIDCLGLGYSVGSWYTSMSIYRL